MSRKGKEGVTMTKEDKKIIEHISQSLARDNQITQEEHIRVQELLREEK